MQQHMNLGCVHLCSMLYMQAYGLFHRKAMLALYLVRCFLVSSTVQGLVCCAW